MTLLETLGDRGLVLHHRPASVSPAEGRAAMASIDRSPMFDTHTHLQDPRITDLEASITRAREAGIARLLCCGTSEKDWALVGELAATHRDFLQPAYGLHPGYIAGRSGDWARRLASRIEADRCAAMGEIGLDGGRDTTASGMEEVFLVQLRLARRLNRPLSIHGRKAWEQLTRHLEREGPFPAGLALHSFSGPPDIVPRLVKAGAFFSFSGSITWERNVRGRRALAAAPLDRLLAETDTPDMPAAGVLPPAPGMRAISEPSHLILVIRAMASARGLDENEMRRLTADNATRLFGKLADG